MKAKRRAAHKIKPLIANINNEQSITEQPMPNKPERTECGNVRVSKPGDANYVPRCETTKAFIGKDHSMECDPKILAEFRESMSGIE